MSTFGGAPIPARGERTFTVLTAVPAGAAAVTGTMIAYSPQAFTTPFVVDGFASVYRAGGSASGVTCNTTSTASATPADGTELRGPGDCSPQVRSSVDRCRSRGSDAA